MNYFLARQPIFNRNLTVYAYELLFRNDSETNSYTSEQNNSDASLSEYDSDDRATSKVLINSYLMADFDSFSSGKKVFINFTKRLVMDESPIVFPNDSLVVELLETIVPDAPFIEKCKHLKNRGYILALDDYVHTRDESNPLLDIIDILKVDFIDNSREEILEISRCYKKKSIKLLAEKVETNDTFNFALENGFTYFQGYFFSKPVIVSGKNLHSNNKNFMLLLNELYKDNPDFNAIAKIIENDVSISYKLLRMINSAAYYSGNEIKSIRQATVMLGIKKLKKWILLLMLVDAGKNQPLEILRTSMIRGHFSEMIALHTRFRKDSSELFIMGLFSMISKIMHAPLDELLKDLPLSTMVKDALMGKDNEYRHIYDLILYYEKGNFAASQRIASELDIPFLTLPEYYKNSILLSEKLTNL